MSTGAPDGPAAKGATRVIEPTSVERGAARRTAESRATVPDIEYAVTVDTSPAEAHAKAIGVSLDAVFLAACAAALRDHPRANAAYRDARFETYSRVNVGWVIAAADTYLIPTVFDADAKDLATLDAELARLEVGARDRSLSAAAYSGATFTVWNAGRVGVERAGIVVNPPQAGALALGAVQDAPIVRDGRVLAGRTATLTLACDHRILYGAAAGAFLGAVRERLSSPGAR